MNKVKAINKISILGLLLILLLSGFLYLYKLDSIPSGLYVDEALSGYNAYSILKTGKDEYGKQFPILFRFFGTYSPPLYTYLSMPIVAINGLTLTSVRFVSAISGLIVVFIVFNLLKSLSIVKFRITPYAGALWLAISPWQVIFTRAGYEIYLGFCLFTLGVYWCWKGLTKSTYLIIGLFTLSLSTYGAHTERFLSPIFIFGLLILSRRKLFSQTLKTQTIFGLLPALIIQIPHFTVLFTPAMWQKQDLFFSQGILEQAQHYFSWLPILIAWLLAAMRKFLAQYFTYFSPRSLFFLPDPDPQRSLPDLSVFYPWMIIPYLIGMYLIWTKRQNQEIKYLLLLLFLTPLPAALTKDPFSTQRALPFLLPMIIVISLGLDELIDKIKNLGKYLSLLIYCFIGLLIIWSLVLLWRSYFLLLPQERAKVWGYGFQQLADFIIQHPKDQFVIDQSRTKPAYIELAFFLQLPLQQIQDSVDQSIKDNYYQQIKFNPERKFANIETRTINWQTDIYRHQILVGDELAVSEEQAHEHYLTQVLEIRDPINQIVFRGYQTNPDLKCQNAIIKSKYCI